MALLSSSPAAAAVAIIAAAAAVAGCYEPALRDCTVTCTDVGQCSSGQICGADGWCAAPDTAGTCGEALADAADPDAAAIDAAPGDATPGDAGDAPIDAAPIILRLVISGRGSIASDQPGILCSNTQTSCDFPVAAGTQVGLTAVNSHPQDSFVDWTTANCQGQGASCTVAISGAVTLVGAMFE